MKCTCSIGAEIPDIDCRELKQQQKELVFKFYRGGKFSINDKWVGYLMPTTGRNWRYLIKSKNRYLNNTIGEFTFKFD